MTSNFKRIVRVTPRAKIDLLEIAKYTELTWGKLQRNKYLKNLDARFSWLSKNPLLGKHRIDVHPLYYSFPEGQHVIFYLIRDSSIDIIGIPHKDMDILSHFS